MDLLEANKNKIACGYLSRNPSIFTYNYELIKEKNKEIKEEIINYLEYEQYIEINEKERITNGKIEYERRIIDFISNNQNKNYSFNYNKSCCGTFRTSYI